MHQISASYSQEYILGRARYYGLMAYYSKFGITGKALRRAVATEFRLAYSKDKYIN